MLLLRVALLLPGVAALGAAAQLDDDAKPATRRYWAGPNATGKVVSISNAETWRNGTWGLAVGSSHVDECLMLKNSSKTPPDHYKIVPGINGTVGAITFESMTTPGSYLAQTGYEAWVQLFTLPILTQRGLNTAEFIVHDSLFIEGYVAFEAAQGDPSGKGCCRKKYITTRDDQGGDEGGYPCRIEGCNSEGSALQWAQQASFCLHDVNDDIDDADDCPDPSGKPTTDCGTNFKFADFSDWVNVFKPGTGTITVWENTGGTRGAQIYQLKGIPLTPGPLMVVIKVAASQTANASAYWPPALPDAIETIAASFTPVAAGQAKVRLFNLAPTAKYVDLKGSGNASGALASNVQYALGSGWVPVAPSAATFSALVDSKVVASKQTAPPPGGVFTTTLLGDAKQGYQLISLSDAPEGGVCKP